MTDPTSSPNPYLAVLADLRAKRAKIDNTIKVLEEMSGISLAEVGDNLQFVAAEKPSHDEGGDAGAYLGMSIVDAAKTLLAKRKRVMGNPEIARELKAGGLALSSADPVNTVGSVLTRRFNQVGDVVRVDRGTWGLKEWYPNRTFKPQSKMSAVNLGTPEAEQPDEFERELLTPMRPANTDQMDESDELLR